MSLFQSVPVQPEPYELVHEVLDQVRQLIEDQPYCCFTLAGERIYLNASSGRFLSDVPLARLIADDGALLMRDIETLTSADAVMQTVEERGRPLDELLWTIAWHCSNGQLLEGCRRNDVVSFSRWPNLTRLPANGTTSRIVALMTARPSSVVLASRLLGVAEEAVAQVYSAGMRAGYAAPVNRVVEMPTLKSHKHKSLIGRLMARLQGS